MDKTQEKLAATLFALIFAIALVLAFTYSLQQQTDKISNDIEQLDK